MKNYLCNKLLPQLLKISLIKYLDHEGINYDNKNLIVNYPLTFNVSCDICKNINDNHMLFLHYFVKHFTCLNFAITSCKNNDKHNFIEAIVLHETTTYNVTKMSTFYKVTLYPI